jgi:cell wall-associated NlpC family hydrolase
MAENKPGLVSTVGTAAAAHATRATGSAVVSTLGWPLIAGALLSAAAVIMVLVASVVIAISRQSADQATFIYQCQSRLGGAVGTAASVQLVTVSPAPSAPTTSAPPAYELQYLQPDTVATPTQSAAPTRPDTAAVIPPRRNPYASLTAPSGAEARTVACVEAMKTGEFVGPPVRRPGTAVGRLAAELAVRRIATPATPAQTSAARTPVAALSPANLVRTVYLQASQGNVVMPENLADQIGVGERVDPGAISPGDLVFSAFTVDAGPTEVMIAISATDGIGAARDGRLAVAPLPTGNVIVKRPRTEPW